MNDCSWRKDFYFFEKGKTNEDRYEYLGGSKDKYVGYVTDSCRKYNDFDCGESEYWMKIGQLLSKKLQLDTTGYGNFQATDFECNQNRSNCGPSRWQIACRKRDSAFTSIKGDTWTDCCENNQLDQLQLSNGITCHPKLYSRNGKYSNACRNICLQNDHSLKKNIEGSAETTLKNNYKNDFCVDVLKDSENPSQSELREFCENEPAFIDGKPNPEYTDVCGCFYPKGYYDKLKEELKQLFPELPESMWNDKSCYSSLCSESKLKELISARQCPNLYFLRCVNNAEFNASNVQGDGSGGIEFDQNNECNIYVDESNTPFCGRDCDSNADCPDDCPCNDNRCRNEDSVSCENYQCPAGKVNKSNGLCSGGKDTCTEGNCCAKINFNNDGGDGGGGGGGGNGGGGGEDNSLAIGLIILGIVLLLIGLIMSFYNGNDIYKYGGNSINIGLLLFGIIFMGGGGTSLYYGVDEYN